MSAAVVVAGMFGGAAWLGVITGMTVCRGRTSFDDGPAPIRFHPLIIAVAGACVGAGVSRYAASPLKIAVLALVIAALAACTACDLTLGIVPDIFTLLPAALLLVYNAMSHQYIVILVALLVALPYALAAVFTHGLGMGWGDVKLAALGGLVLGGQSLMAFLLASVVAVTVSRAWMRRRQPIAFAPYLAGGIGAMIALGSRT